MTFQILLNGKPETLEEGTALGQLLEARGLSPQRAAVELNLQLLPREKYASTLLREGDALEVVNFVGGG